MSSYYNRNFDNRA